MRRIVVDPGERVDEHRDSFFEGDTVLSRIGLRLLRVPGELNRHKAGRIPFD